MFLSVKTECEDFEQLIFYSTQNWEKKTQCMEKSQDTISQETRYKMRQSFFGMDWDNVVKQIEMSNYLWKILIVCPLK